jgi:peptide/nickel transport system substrate-binding protein
VKSPIRKLTWLVGVVAVFAVASAMGASAHTTKGSTSKSGGTLNLGWEQAFNFTDNGDPTGEYLGDWFGIADNLLVRTLIGYTHQPGGPGNEPIADIATKVPKPTNGGKTYTFDIKPGVMFSPPVSRQVVCNDFVNAMQRLANPKDGGQYGFYYAVIKGWSQYSAGKAKSISGIKCLSKSRIQFNLTAPTGDFLKRMGMPATGPQPAEVTKCFSGQAGKYGLDLISTAGYMYKGIDKVDISSCSKLKPADGYDGQTQMDLVRNPNYKQSTDPYRKNYVDEVRFLVDASSVDIYNKIEAGQFDFAAVSSIPNNVLKKYVTTPSLKSHFFQNSGDRTWYLTMNITQPPFDDIHVRRAMNWIIDKSALRQTWGGPTVGDIANHIVPDSLFGGQLADYKPYRTIGDHGSVVKARLAMKGSQYADKTGMCVAKECKNVLLIADARAVDPGMVSTMQQDAKKIGITFTVRTINGAYPTVQTVAKNVPISERPGWGKDYADALTFFSPLFDGRTIIPTGNTNYSLVGITKSQCTTLKVVGDCEPYNAKTGMGVPSVNSQLDKCAVLIDPARQTCYENLDKTLMTNVVPWVPWMWSKVTKITGNNVTHYQFDQFSTTAAYSQISVK